MKAMPLKGSGSIHGWSTTMTKTNKRYDTNATDYVGGARLKFWIMLAIVVVALVVLS